MPDPTSDTSSYRLGYSEEFRGLLERRSAETHAAHLLPHLRPGLRVLDFGCGPGTISVGLARAVAPGEVHGIDMEASQIDVARSAAAAGGHDNATFHVGVVTDLPFEDDSFDVAHCHAVLMHVPDTRAALSEVKRVLKPGGIIASREMFVASSFLEPGAETLATAWAVFSNLLAANGGHPQMGKELKNIFLEAGFSNVQARASFDAFSTTEEVAFLHAFTGDWFFSPEVIAGGHDIWAGDPSAVRRVAPEPQPMENPSGGIWSVRLWRGYRPEAVVLSRIDAQQDNWACLIKLSPPASDLSGFPLPRE